MLTNPLTHADFVPADHGLVAWPYDPVAISAGAALPVAGTLQVVKLKLTQPTLITAAVALLSVVGSTLTAGQNFAMLFDSTGARVAVTADLSSSWSSGVGTKDMPFTAPVTVSGPFCWVGMYANGSVLPSFRLASTASVTGNANLATASSRFGLADSGLTTTPPATLGAITSAAVPWWFAVR